MKRVVWLILLSALLAGCEDFPIEGGDDFAAVHGNGIQTVQTPGALRGARPDKVAAR